MRQDGVVRQEVALRVLHANGGVDTPGQREAPHVGDEEVDIEALVLRAGAEEIDVLRGEVETGHPVTAFPQPDQVRARAARDVEHALDGPARVAPEAVDEEIHLLLSVHVEGDLVVARRRVLSGARVAGAPGFVMSPTTRAGPRAGSTRR